MAFAVVDWKVCSSQVAGRGGLPVRLALLFALASSCTSAFPVGDVVRGEALYEARCTGCHSLDVNRTGPLHKGVVGRRAGSVPDYNYSSAVKKSGIVWTEPMLARWLTNPEALIPGQKMGFSVPDPTDREDIIAFLAQASKSN